MAELSADDDTMDYWSSFELSLRRLRAQAVAGCLLTNTEMLAAVDELPRAIPAALPIPFSRHRTMLEVMGDENGDWRNVMDDGKVNGLKPSDRSPGQPAGRIAPLPRFPRSSLGDPSTPSPRDIS